MGCSHRAPARDRLTERPNQRKPKGRNPKNKGEKTTYSLHATSTKPSLPVREAAALRIPPSSPSLTRSTARRPSSDSAKLNTTANANRTAPGSCATASAHPDNDDFLVAPLSLPLLLADCFSAVPVGAAAAEEEPPRDGDAGEMAAAVDESTGTAAAVTASAAASLARAMADGCGGRVVVGLRGERAAVLFGRRKMIPR